VTPATTRWSAPMTDPTKKEAIERIKGAVSDARWAGLTEEEIKAVFTSAVLEAFAR
jgi:hypothetical protein